MRRCGIICEYNPFHAGHAHLIEEARASGAETVVCLMSGDFTQRGEAAILPPVPRAAMALAGGADLVLELPFPFSSGSARYFATAGVRALAALGCDTLVFGSECADVAELRRVAARSLSDIPRNGAENEPIAANYFAALGTAPASNDILAVEYLRAVEAEKLPLSPFAVKRIGAAYRDVETLTETSCPSAAALRAALLAGKPVSDFLPPAVRPIFGEALVRFGTADTAALGAPLLAALRVGGARAVLGISSTPLPPATVWEATVRETGEFADCGGGLAERLADAAYRARDYESLCREAATKKYTAGHIRRALLYTLAGVRTEDLAAPPAYLRLLAANGKGRAFLSETRKTRTVPIVTKPSDAVAAGVPAHRARELALVADALYALCLGGRISVSDLQTMPPVMTE